MLLKSTTLVYLNVHTLLRRRLARLPVDIAVMPILIHKVKPTALLEALNAVHVAN